MADTITAPIIVDTDGTPQTEALCQAAFLAAKTKFNFEERVEKIEIVSNDTQNGVVFYNFRGAALYLRGVRAGYPGNSPRTLNRILQLFGVSERDCKKIQEAARRTGEIRYKITLTAKFGERKGFLGDLEWLATGNRQFIRWSWRREY